MVLSLCLQPKDWTIQMNKKERRLAMGSALQSAASATTVVEDLTGTFPAPKTATMYNTMAGLGVQLADKQEHAVLIVDNLTDAIKKSGSNIPNLKVGEEELPAPCVRFLLLFSGRVGGSTPGYTLQA